MFSKALAITTLHLAAAPPAMAWLASFGYGPGEVGSKNWDTAMKNPNTTGSVPIVGYNVSKPWPARDSRKDDWSLDAKLVADMPSADNKDEFYTGIGLALSPPDYLVQKLDNGTKVIDADGSWHGCLTAVADLPDDVLKNGYDDDGSCHSLLGEECAKQYRAALMADMSGGKCSASVTIPDACQDTLGNFSAIAVGFPLNGTDLWNSDFIRFGSDSPHQKGDTGDYESLVKKTYPVFIAFTGNDTEATSYQSGNSDQNYGNLACIRASKIMPGSKKVNGGSDVSKLSLATSVVIAAAMGIVLL